MFPRADIPVIQLAIHSGEDLQYHVDLGARLAPLRERGIFILGSGNVVHNLRRLDRSRPEEAWDWAQRFDDEVHDIMTREPARLADTERHPDYDAAVPTPEHFLPLAYLAGLCRAAGEPAHRFLSGGSLGALTMSSYVLGNAPHAEVRGSNAGAADLPDPRRVPPEQTNM